MGWVASDVVVVRLDLLSFGGKSLWDFKRLSLRVPDMRERESLVGRSYDAIIIQVDLIKRNPKLKCLNINFITVSYDTFIIFYN